SNLISSFFFSSRRRHTRCLSDWSSDVCSSDLSAAEKPPIIVGSPPELKGEPNIWAPEELLVGSVNTCMMLTFLSLAQARGLTARSEERRVGKECRSRRAREHETRRNSVDVVEG